MEYVQTVLAQVAPNRVADADQIVSELEQHRDYASSQRGFRGMNIRRTANPEGNILVVAETRWANNNAMADYSTLKTNAATIFGAHTDALVPNSLQVHRMESVTSEVAQAPNRAYDRLALALFIPMGVLAFALLVIYSLSRIYLVLPGESATPLAAGVAIAIMLVCWYFATNPTVPRWQILGVAAIAVATLAVGGTAAAVYDNNHHENKTVAAPSPTAGPSTGPAPTPGPPGAVEVDMQDDIFVSNGQQDPTITIAGAGKDNTINLKNTGSATHNMHISSTGTYTQTVCKATGTEPCSKPAAMPGASTGTITFNLPAGTYQFRCDFHPAQMHGEIVVQ